MLNLNELFQAQYHRPVLKPSAIPKFPDIPSKAEKRPFPISSVETVVNAPEPPKKKPSPCPVLSLQKQLQNENLSLQLPPSWSMVYNTPKCLIFSNFMLYGEPKPIFALPLKQVCIVGEEISLSLLGLPIPRETIEKIGAVCDIGTFQQFLDNLEGTNFCRGLDLGNKITTSNIAFKDCLGNWRHTNCSLLLTDQSQDICSKCTRLRKTTHQKSRRRVICLAKHKAKSSLLRAEMYRNRVVSAECRSAISSVQRTVHKKKISLNRLKNELHSVRKKLSKSNISGLEQTISQNESLPRNCGPTIKEIMASMQKSSRGRRYSDDWIILCLLFHIRSPKGYDFIRNTNMLPLPCPRTMRRYLSMIDTRCGFDENFLKMFERRMRQKKEYLRHGILSVDEIVVRESIAVDSKTLTYVGLSDFGDELPAGQDLSEKANHGLVFMFQPLADIEYTQPIAVFASHGTVNGTELAKLTVKAIILLERAGAVLHGTVADGAKSNRKVWKILGVNGKRGLVQNWFQHPTQPDRKIFVFSDTPHLIKCIRNLLYTKNFQTSPCEPLIQWQHFTVLHDVDSQLPGHLRACPNITRNHVELSTSGKMRVRLATQVFSESVSIGLRFYSTQGVAGLENVEATVEFCLQINRMFDALNRKIPIEGVSPESNDFKVLQNSIAWLDRWESFQEQGKLEGAFLSAGTAEGFRVTLHSALDLCLYRVSPKFRTSL